MFALRSLWLFHEMNSYYIQMTILWNKDNVMHGGISSVHHLTAAQILYITSCGFSFDLIFSVFCSLAFDVLHHVVSRLLACGSLSVEEEPQHILPPPLCHAYHLL